MKPYSIDLREKIFRAAQGSSIRSTYGTGLLTVVIVPHQPGKRCKIKLLI
jgi:hypothetical protein